MVDRNAQPPELTILCDTECIHVMQVVLRDMYITGYE